MAGPDTLPALEQALTASGIHLRGVVSFADGEGPELSAGGVARTVVLVGNVGGSIWPAFTAWRETQIDGGGKNPLDAWSKAVIGPLAARFEATAWFPSDPPYMPFQTWARQAEGLTASPLGILIHPHYGLWHGYRGALGFAERLDAPAKPNSASPCGDCRGKPCLGACPAGAITTGGFDVASCRLHLVTEAGRAGCMARGCAARNACPVGAEYRYGGEQLAFHMAALFPKREASDP